jgi:hypothetical protein
MLMLEDLVKTEPAVGITVGLVALAAPLFIPALRPELRPMLKSAAKLLVEAEFGADGEIITQLADAAIDDLLGEGRKADQPERNRRIEARVERFARKAHQRAARMGHDEADRRARYRRHMRTLGTRLAARRERMGGRDRELLDHAQASVEQRQ